MGELVVDYGRLIEQYGKVGVQLHTFQEYHRCVVDRVNSGKDDEGCIFEGGAS